MIELQNLGMSYQVAGATLSILDGLDLSVARAERLAIIGPSGSGKTTLLLVLTGLEQATTGKIVIDGIALDSLNNDERADLRRELIGVVFQSFHLIPTLNALENVALPLDIAGEKGSRERASRMLEKVGLQNRFKNYPSQLSGGEQQRVAIARALVHEPQLIVADEPTGNLDGQTGESVIQLLFELNRSFNSTLILVTHDPALASRCDRQLRLQDGSLHPVIAA
jgi:putative ABC transport system ATP-binding protein